jgi:hypothetical protein
VAVDVRLDRGDATVVVRRTLTNGGERDDQAVLDVQPPKGGVGVGLRMLTAEELAAVSGTWQVEL